MTMDDEQGEAASTMLDVLVQEAGLRSGMADKPVFAYPDNGQDVGSSLSFAELDRRATHAALVRSIAGRFFKCLKIASPASCGKGSETSRQPLPHTFGRPAGQTLSCRRGSC